MSFNVRIRFVGMFVFTPRDGEMHVLLPSTAGLTDDCDCGADEGGGTGGTMTQGAPMPQHSARLLFDAGHLLPTDTRKLNLRVHETLQGREMAITGGGHEPVDETLPAALARIPLQVKEDAFSRGAQNLVVSRILLGHGHYYAYAPGHCWDWQGTRRRMTHIVEWVVPNVDGDSLRLELNQLSGAFDTAIEALYPIDGWVDLHVWHVPPTEIPPVTTMPLQPDLGTPAPHAHALFRLFENGPTECPTYAGTDCSPPVDAGVLSEDSDDGRGMSPYSCMGATGP
jgi:hypothetical protein